MPSTSFSENELSPGGSRQTSWFALDETRPVAFFAGIWTRWTSVRKVREGEVTADLFGFLTCEPNAEVGVVHPQAMPVILTTVEEREIWLRAPWGAGVAKAAGGRDVAGRGERREAGRRGGASQSCGAGEQGGGAAGGSEGAGSLGV